MEATVTDNCERRSSRALPWLIGVTVLAAALRVYAAVGSEIRGDEYGTLKYARESVGVLLGFYGDTLTMHLYVLMMKAWMACFGESALSLKIPSVIAGAATVPLVFQLTVSRLGSRIALVTALAAAVNFALIQYSRTARSYALLTMMVVLSMILYLRVLERPRWYSVAGLVLLNAAALATSLIAACFIGVQVLHAAVIEVRRGTPFSRKIVTVVAAAAASTLAGVAFYSRMLGDIVAFRSDWVRGDEWLRTDWMSQTLRHYHLELFWIVLPLAGAGVWFSWKRNRSFCLLIVLWALLPWLYFAVSGSSHSRAGFGRFLVPVLPAQLVLVAAGLVGFLEQLPRLIPARGSPALAAVILLIPCMTADLPVRLSGREPVPFEAAFEQIAAAADDADVVAITLFWNQRPEILDAWQSRLKIVRPMELAANWPPPSPGTLHIISKRLPELDDFWSEHFQVTPIPADRRRDEMVLLRGPPGSAGGKKLRASLRHHFEGFLQISDEKKIERNKALRHNMMLNIYEMLGRIAYADGDTQAVKKYQVLHDERERQEKRRNRREN